MGSSTNGRESAAFPEVTPDAPESSGGPKCWYRDVADGEVNSVPQPKPGFDRGRRLNLGRSRVYRGRDCDLDLLLDERYPIMVFNNLECICIHKCVHVAMMHSQNKILFLFIIF
jgi:hypothetical protein